MTSADIGAAHPERKEIARYLLSRGLDPTKQTPDPTRMAAIAAPAAGAVAAPAAGFVFPAELAPAAAPLDPAPATDDPLPPRTLW
jgi:hypothetical protein